MSVELTISPSAITSKGGLLVNNGTSLVELPVGSNGQVLTATSTATNGVAWLNNSYSSTAYVKIASGTTTADSTEITINSIPTTYSNLVLNIHGSAVSAGTVGDIYVQFNSDTASANYNWVGLAVMTSTFSSNVLYGAGAFVIKNALAGTTSFTADSRSISQLWISQYSDTSKYKYGQSRNNNYSSWIGATANRLNFDTSIWKSTSAITSMKIFIQSASFRSGLIYSLYGF